MYGCIMGECMGAGGWGGWVDVNVECIMGAMTLFIHRSNCRGSGQRKRARRRYSQHCRRTDKLRHLADGANRRTDAEHWRTDSGHWRANVYQLHAHSSSSVAMASAPSAVHFSNCPVSKNLLIARLVRISHLRSCTGCLSSFRGMLNVFLSLCRCPTTKAFLD